MKGPEPPELRDRDGGPSRRQTLAVAAASLVAAGSNFVLMYIGSRTLPAEEGTEFLAFWSLLTGIFGVISGVQNEVTRGVGQVGRGRPRGTRAIAPAVVVGTMVAIILSLFSPAIVSRVVPLSGSSGVVALLLTTIGYSIYVTLVGALAGHNWWSHYAALLASEVVLRVTLLVSVLMLGASLGGYELAACGATGVTVLYLLFSKKSRLAIVSRTDTPFVRSLSKYLLAMVSTTGTAVLITAYGAILKAVAAGTDPLELGGLILTVSLTRAPIMIPLTAFTGVAISYFLQHRDRPVAAVMRPSLVLLVVGAAGGALAWFVGPWIVRFFNSGYDVPPWVFGALTFSSSFIAILTLFGTVVLALDNHLAYAFGWALAAVVSVVILFAPGELSLRVVCSMSIGPLSGVVGLMIWLATNTKAVTGRVSQPSPPPDVR